MRIFYSWQSDLPSETHKDYLLSCLKDTLANVNSEIEIISSARPEEFIELDHDTKGVPGSPEIFSTIVQKIDQSDLFVADLSFVGQTLNFNNQKKMPNSNVLIELGYAQSALSSDRILLLLDTDNGKPSELPFDLRHKKIIAFCSQHNNAEQERKRFVEDLTSEIKTAVSVYGERSTKRDLQKKPAYNDIVHVIINSDSQSDWKLVVQNDRIYTRYFLEDINLRFVTDHDTNVHRENFREEWATKFPCSEASSWYTDLYFNSTILQRFVLVYVDDRVSLPLPDRARHSVSPLQYQVAKIHDHSNLVSSYLKREHITISRENLDYVSVK